MLLVTYTSGGGALSLIADGYGSILEAAKTSLLAGVTWLFCCTCMRRTSWVIPSLVSKSEMGPGNEAR